MCGCGCSGKEKEVVSQARSKPELSREVNPCLKNGQQYMQAQQVPETRRECVGNYERHMYEQQDEDICDKDPKEPYHIPGYAGHVPTLQSRAGGTFGDDTHQALTDTGLQVSPPFSQGGHVCPKPMHEPYHLPGYTGHVPGLQFMFGGTFGQDTHKLMYSSQSPPNRQENLSPYSPNRVNQGHGSGEMLDLQPNNGYYTNALTHSNMAPTEEQLKFYKKPTDHYFKPQYKYRIGDTYATTTDLTLVDPCVNEQSNIVVSTRELDDAQVVRAADTLEARVQELPFLYAPIRHHPMVPGFDTFIDAMRGARGQRYEFTGRAPAHLRLQQQLILAKGGKKESQSPVSHNGNTPPRMINAAGNGNGEMPYGYGKYAEPGTRQRFTNSALYDFTSNYRRRQSSEWAPVTASRPDPPSFDSPGEIYTPHSGLLPGYSAHVPGAMFRCGKTFTDDSRDAKRALRGDRF